jgi:uncharacterized protein
MVQDDVEVVRESVSAYNRRDLDALRACYAADVEVDWSESRGPLQGIYRGRDEVLAFLQEFFDAFEAIDLGAQDFIERSGAVLVPMFTRFIGRDGIETSARAAISFRIEDGRIAHMRLHQEMPEPDVEGIGARR